MKQKILVINEIKQNEILLKLKVEYREKVDYKILVSFEQIQNFEALSLAMVKVKKVNIAVTYLWYHFNNVSMKKNYEIGIFFLFFAILSLSQLQRLYF
jgi:hypothetical protein